MFNVCVNAVIREFCWTIDKEATHGVFAVACREMIVAFVVDNRLVGSRDPVAECSQHPRDPL